MPRPPLEKQRLRERFGAQPVSPADRQARKSEWLEIQREFTRLGIDPVLLTYVVAQARVGRCLFEEDLATPLVRPKGRARALERALKHVDALSIAPVPGP